jgi:hypothetical protein
VVPQVLFVGLFGDDLDDLPEQVVVDHQDRTREPVGFKTREEIVEGAGDGARTARAGTVRSARARKRVGKPRGLNRIGSPSEAWIRRVQLRRRGRVNGGLLE